MIERRPPERLQGWLATGPLGQLYAVLVDITLLWGRWAFARARARARG